MSALTHLPATTTTDEIVAQLRSTGAVIVDNLADDDRVDTLLTEMQPYIDATPLGGDDFTGRTTKRTGALIGRSPASHWFLQHALVLGSARGLLDHATNIQVHLTQVISIGPDAPAQQIHRDQWAFDFHPFPRGFDVQCNTIWALDDFTEENGATRVVPGSNGLEDGLRFAVEDSIAAEMSKGSVLFYSGSVYHGGGANRSGEVRRALNLTYNVAWLRQEENQYLSVPAEKARDLPDDLLRLMGYAIGAYALGYVDDTRDPLEVLRGVESSALGAFGATIRDQPQDQP